MNVFLLTSVPLAPPWDQGDKNLAYALTRALPEIDFQVLTARRATPPEGSNLLLADIFHSHRPGLMQKALVYAWMLVQEWRRQASRRLINRRQVAQNGSPSPDLYHLIYRPYPISTSMLRRLPDLRRRPVIHTVPATASGPPLHPGLFFADRVVALSDSGRQRLSQAGLPNVLHIPQGVDVCAWRATGQKTQAYKAELGLSGRPVLLFPGHYSPGQGADSLLAALPAIIEAVPQAVALFACRLRSTADRRREADTRRKVQRLGLQHAVRFFNTEPDMHRLIGASDLVALPLSNLRDKIDLPTTLLEGLAAGKPALISALPPMDELLHVAAERVGPVGLATPPGDVNALTQAAIRLLSDAALRRQMGSAGQTVIARCFDIESIANRYSNLYAELLHENASPYPTRTR